MLSCESMYRVIKIAVRAGRESLRYYESSSIEVGYKEDSSPLTKADQASHNLIVQGLEQISDCPVLSEEAADIPYSTRKNWTQFWLVDPLDGTKEFIKKNGEFTVNIALVSSGEVKFGVVYAPVLDVLYVGGQQMALKLDNSDSIVGNSSSLDDISDNAATINVANEVSGALNVVVSKSHCNKNTEAFVEVLESRYGKIEAVSCGSSLKLCMVADGRANIYPRLGPTMEWDTAAAHAVVNAAGGSVVDYTTNQELCYNKQSLLNPYFIVSDKQTVY